MLGVGNGLVISARYVQNDRNILCDEWYCRAQPLGLTRLGKCLIVSPQAREEVAIISTGVIEARIELDGLPEMRLRGRPIPLIRSNPSKQHVRSGMRPLKRMCLP